MNCKWVGTRWQWLFYMYTECDIEMSEQKTEKFAIKIANL
jgi:hypothetical protein